MVCEKDRSIMEPAFNATRGQLRGWVCPACLKVAHAIGRERYFTEETLPTESNVAQIQRVEAS